MLIDVIGVGKGEFLLGLECLGGVMDVLSKRKAKWIRGI
jgi:hypothetical protein